MYNECSLFPLGVRGRNEICVICINERGRLTTDLLWRSNSPFDGIPVRNNIYITRLPISTFFLLCSFNSSRSTGFPGFKAFKKLCGFDFLYLKKVFNNNIPSSSSAYFNNISLIFIISIKTSCIYSHHTPCRLFLYANCSHLL